MSLSPEVIRGLEGEMRRLEEERRRIDATMASIRQLLGQAAPSDEARAAQGEVGPTGFRDGIRTVLREARKPLTPKEVAEAIRIKRYPGSDFENLPNRLYNDLWKMKEAGQLEKIGDGYALVGEGGEGVSKR